MKPIADIRALMLEVEDRLADTPTQVGEWRAIRELLIKAERIADRALVATLGSQMPERRGTDRGLLGDWKAGG
jgi:hypothetical protein